MKSLFLTLAVLVGSASFAHAQGTEKTSKEVGPIKSSAAFAEISLRRAELESDIDAFLADYTEQNPKVVDARNELRVLLSDLDRVYAVRPTETAKLTEALGKLIVRRAVLETDVERLLRTYNKDHPTVKRAKRKAEIFENAIRDILG